LSAVDCLSASPDVLEVDNCRAAMLAEFEPTRAAVAAAAVRRWSNAAAGAVGVFARYLGYDADDETLDVASTGGRGRSSLLPTSVVCHAPALASLLRNLRSSPPRVEGSFAPGVSDDGSGLVEGLCVRFGWLVKDEGEGLYVWHGAPPEAVAVFKIDRSLRKLRNLSKRHPKNTAFLKQAQNLLAVKSKLEEAKANADVVEALRGAKDALEGLRLDVDEVEGIMEGLRIGGDEV